MDAVFKFISSEKLKNVWDQIFDSYPKLFKIYISLFM